LYLPTGVAYRSEVDVSGGVCLFGRFVCLFLSQHENFQTFKRRMMIGG